jgi:hypothetical protein
MPPPPMPWEALVSGLRLDHPFTIYNFPAQALVGRQFSLPVK